MINAVYPVRCPVCDKIVSADRLVCEGCKRMYSPVLEPYCLKCGKQLTDNNEVCYDCERRKHSYERGFALYNYNVATRRSIIAFKYKGRAEYAHFFATQIAQKYYNVFKRYKINAVLPVPIHKERQRLRGYNQAGLIVDYLCEITGFMNLDGFLIRDKNTLPLKELDDVERRRNLLNAFVINKEFSIPKGIENVLIVDDIYTTGTTVDVCTKVIKSEIKCKVYFVVLAIGRGL